MDGPFGVLAGPENYGAQVWRRPSFHMWRSITTGKCTGGGVLRIFSGDADLYQTGTRLDYHALSLSQGA